MKLLYSLTFLMSLVVTSFAQTTFWTEDFGTGCNQGQLASAYSGPNGAWSVTDFSSGNNAANKFYVSATEAGMGAGNCGQGCIDNVSLTSQTLHVGGSYVEFQSFPIVEEDLGASYNSGGIQSFGFISETNMVAQSPLINCSGYQNIVLSFDYMEGGDLAFDDADLRYYNGTAWGVLDALEKTVAGCPTGQGLWTNFTYTLPSTINDLSNFRIAFGWGNNDDGAGSDPSFAVDNITLTGDITTGINNASGGGLRIRQFDKIIEVAFTDVDEEIMIVKAYDILGQELTSKASKGTNRTQLETGNLSGVVILQIESTSGISTRKMVLR